MVATLEGRSVPEVVAAAIPRGVLATAMDAATLRLVTHRDAPRADCEMAAKVLEEVMK